METKSKIIIIGAGASGIAAATRLSEHGCEDFIILEAEDRLGGRIHSVPFEETFLDLGAQWCHGQEQNIVYQLVKDLNLLETSFNNYRDNTFYNSNGKLIDKNVTDSLSEIAASIFEDCETMSTTKYDTYGDYFIARYDEKVNEKFGTNKECLNYAKHLLHWFHKFVLCLDASPSWFDFSPSGSLHYKECDGDQVLHWRNKGYKTIFDVLMKKLSDSSHQLDVVEKIVFNKEVVKIDWGTNEVSISCSDGSNYTASYVIITVSLGVLKQNYQKLFEPELPIYKKNAIEGLSIGTVNKILLKFPFRWWPTDCKGFSLVWSEDDSANLSTEFLHGPSKNGKSWLEDIFGFYTIDSHSQVLLGWVVGELATEVESLPDEIVISGCMFLLKKFLGDLYEIPHPELCLRSEWYRNPHFCGSYSYRSIETEKRNTSPEELARPLVGNDKQERIFFAGEATHSRYYSTVHGAIETGYREADRILQICKQLKTYTVAIVGGGLAGLAAAKTLVNAGVKDIVILEADNRVGGRARTITLEDGFLEIGAQWIHGKHNAMYKFAEKYNLISEECVGEAQGIFVRDDGVVFDEMLVNRVDFEIGKILLDCEKYVDAVDFPTSVGDYLEECFLKYLENSNDSKDVKQKKLELYDWHVRFQIIDNSCIDIKKLSAKEWGRYEISSDGQAHIGFKHGYMSMINMLVKSLPENTIILESPVNSIEYGKYVKLKCNDKCLFAKHAIITVSLGVLKSLLCHIYPPLPQSTQDSINRMGFYGIGKIFLMYNSNWWNEVRGFQLLWRKDTILHEDEVWMQQITGFDVITSHPNVLLGWVGGKGAEQMEQLTEMQIAIQCTGLFQKFLGNMFENIPLPHKVIRSKWTNCQWVKGAYSYCATECEILETRQQNLSNPVYVDNEPKILFAGEAVHDVHFSTTHGAYESGQNQANILVNYLSAFR